MTLSFKILRFNYYVAAMIPFATSPEAIARFGFSAAQVLALTNFLIDWNAKLSSYVNPLTNGHVTVDAINGAYQYGFTLVTSIKNQVKNNTTVTLSSEERAIFGIRKAVVVPGSKGIPKSSPAITCVIQVALSMTLVALDPLNIFKRAKPPGVSYIGFKTAITETGALPPKPADYVRQENETETIFEILFTSAQVGKTFYIIGFYINSKGEAGKDGIPYSIIIM
ncbi:MAG: hypothetical protein WCH21_12855 [Bacteroidota bacterium]